MIISIDGTGPRNADKLEEATRFFASLLLHSRTVKKIMLDIEVVRGLDVAGECILEDDYKSPRFFTIRLRRQPIEEMIRTLAHEMVHIKQYAKNELTEYTRIARGSPRIGTMWQGEMWEPKSKEDRYWDAPWELQAYGMEVGLQYKWATRKDPKTKWHVGS